ncbi:MAG TPA: hypothetical protein PK586_09135 [Casimicrobium sp.]|nr:hypothetical protein [Casimicrobium sp.]
MAIDITPYWEFKFKILVVLQDRASQKIIQVNNHAFVYEDDVSAATNLEDIGLPSGGARAGLAKALSAVAKSLNVHAGKVGAAKVNQLVTIRDVILETASKASIAVPMGEPT